jgi:hypothetical protein
MKVTRIQKDWLSDENKSKEVRKQEDYYIGYEIKDINELEEFAHSIESVLALGEKKYNEQIQKEVVDSLFTV